MANYRAVANGNWSSGATWGGGAVPPNGEGHNIYSNNFTVTIDQNVDVALITNAAITASFVGGGTSAAQGGVFNVSSSSVSTIIGNIHGQGGNTTYALNFSAASPAALSVTGNVSQAMVGNGSSAINLSGSGILTINGNLTGGASTGQAANAVTITSTGSLVVNNAIFTNIGSTYTSNTNSSLINNSSTGSVTLNNCQLTAATTYPAVNNNSTGSVVGINCIFTASNSGPAITSTNASATNRFSGTFISSTNGTQPINAPRWILNSSPTASYIQHALDGINANSFVRYFTADNSLGQANPTDVRSGVSYASGNLTGRLTIPARGTVANGVTVGPNMPFTATRSGTTATATLTYSYPYQVGDVITVTGASNAEWNMDYTITEVVSGTSVRWTVPATHSATAGTGANAQTKGTAVLDGSSVAAAVWGSATRTLTSASGPTAVEIRQEMDTNSTKLANLDATVSSRLAASAVNTTRLANVATVESTGAALAAALTAP